MAFTLANWTCVSASLNQGQENVIPFMGSSIVGNAPNIFMYGSPNDTAATIGVANYFLSKYSNLSVGDWIMGFGTDQAFIYQVTSSSSSSVTVVSIVVGLAGTVTYTPPSITGNVAIWSNTTGNLQNGGALGTAAFKAASNNSNPTLASISLANVPVVFHIATFSDTSGTIGADNSTAIHRGTIQSGVNNVQGSFACLPPTLANGLFIVTATNAGGAFNTTITNTTMAQSTVYSIPDVTNAVGRLLAAATATPFVSGHLPAASGTGGKMVDSGVLATNIQQKSGIVAATSGNIASVGDPTSIAVTVAGLTASSVVVAQIVSSDITVGAAYILATTVGSGSFTVTTGGIPTTSLIINYIAFIAPQ